MPLKLINEPVDNWEFQNKSLPYPCEPENLSAKYKSIVVRSSERVERSYAKKNWKYCWSVLQKIIKNQVKNTFVLSEDNNLKNLECLFKLGLRQEKKIGIVRKTPIQMEKEKFIIFILRMAAPVALWFRPEVPPNCNEQVDGLLGCCIDRLIETVANKRLEALPKSKDTHIGHHICLLWENPYRLPPDINYSMPSN